MPNVDNEPLYYATYLPRYILRATSQIILASHNLRKGYLSTMFKRIAPLIYTERVFDIEGIYLILGQWEMMYEIRFLDLDSRIMRTKSATHPLKIKEKYVLSIVGASVITSQCPEISHILRYCAGTLSKNAIVLARMSLTDFMTNISYGDKIPTGIMAAKIVRICMMTHFIV